MELLKKTFPEYVTDERIVFLRLAIGRCFKEEIRNNRQAGRISSTPRFPRNRNKKQPCYFLETANTRYKHLFWIFPGVLVTVAAREQQEALPRSAPEKEGVSSAPLPAAYPSENTCFLSGIRLRSAGSVLPKQPSRYSFSGFGDRSRTHFRMFPDFSAFPEISGRLQPLSQYRFAVPEAVPDRFYEPAYLPVPIQVHLCQMLSNGPCLCRLSHHRQKANCPPNRTNPISKLAAKPQ